MPSSSGRILRSSRDATAMKLDAVSIAVLAKAPVPGLAKTRLVPALGAEGAARLQARLIERTLATACTAGLGPVTLWTTPDERPFHDFAVKFDVVLARQPEGDLGQRMHAAVEAASPALVIGTDCPVLEPAHLHEAAARLRDAAEVVVIPAEDGGYVLIGLRCPRRALFDAMPWGTGSVMPETRRRTNALGLVLLELATLWDIDVPMDLARLQTAGLSDLMAPIPRPAAERIRR